MPVETLLQSLGQIVQIGIVDLLLSGDNAIVIALACRDLPPAERRTALTVGVVLAIALRVLLTLAAGFVLQLPALRLTGALVLAAIAVKLLLPGAPGRVDAVAAGDRVGSALRTVIVADLAMSVDNVVALSAVSQGHAATLVLGLLLSVPLLMLGSAVVAQSMQRWPLLVPAGAASLGWLAGGLAVADPLYAATVREQSPALAVVVPALSAAWVLLQARVMRDAMPAAWAMRPRAARPFDAGSGATQAPPVGSMPAPPATGRATESLPAEPAEQAPTEPAPAPAIASETGWSARRRRWRPLAAGAAGAAAIAALVYAVFNAHLPAPSEKLVRYDCTGSDVSLFYAHGALHMRIVSGDNDLRANVGPDNQLDWGDLIRVSRRLGFVPPLKVMYSDDNVLRVDGGMFQNRTCTAHG